MTNTVLHFFVDTNLFIQCHPLEQLDWSPWRAFEEVRLIVTRPVLREIDRLKTKGNDRVGRRARAASAMFREILDDAHKLIRPQSPRVILSVEPQHSYNLDLRDRLDFQERDDQLIGTVHEFARTNSSGDVRLLTHDTIPLYTARSLGVQADIIPDDWLLPPEKTESERRLTVLEAENARLKSAEPSVSLRCANPSDTEVDRYSETFTWFEPLTDAEVDGLMQRLKARFPLATDFGSSEPVEQPPPPTVAARLFATHRTFVPVTDEEIEKYRTDCYPTWLERCEEMLRTHHRTLQRDAPLLEFTFLAENVGTRPAADVLVTIEAHGGFQIKPPPFEDEDEEQEGEDESPTNVEAGLLPRPPTVPRGSWRNTLPGPLGDSLRALDQICRSWHAFPGLAHGNRDFTKRRLDRLPFIRPEPRDPNAFYYKPRRPSTPQDTLALECAQWRHGDEPEPFMGEIHVPTDDEQVKGLLVCRIQAANLSQSVSSCIPDRIAISHVSAFESASNMVDTLIEFPDYRIGVSYRRSDSSK